MRSAQQWMEQFNRGLPMFVASVTVNDIIAIQSDALRHAASLVHDISRGTKSEDRAIAIDDAVRVLISEANLFGAPNAPSDATNS